MAISGTRGVGPGQCGQPHSADEVVGREVVERPIEDVVFILHQAALAAWEIGDREGITSEFHYLGLGIYLACGNAAALLPADHRMSQSWPPPMPPAATDPVRLVRSAETQLQCMPVETVQELADLRIQLCELVAEIGEHGA